MLRRLHRYRHRSVNETKQKRKKSFRHIIITGWSFNFALPDKSPEIFDIRAVLDSRHASPCDSGDLRAGFFFREASWRVRRVDKLLCCEKMRNFCIVIVADNEITENEKAERLRSGGRIIRLAAWVNKVLFVPTFHSSCEAESPFSFMSPSQLRGLSKRRALKWGNNMNRRVNIASMMMCRLCFLSTRVRNFSRDNSSIGSTIFVESIFSVAQFVFWALPLRALSANRHFRKRDEWASSIIDICFQVAFTSDQGFLGISPANPRAEMCHRCAKPIRTVHSYLFVNLSLHRVNGDGLVKKRESLVCTVW